MSRPTTVLVVDDERTLVDLVSAYLSREGFVVFGAHDGPSAVELARTRQPDVVVLDLMLPGMDGLEVCRQLRQFSDAYVLMLTARSDEVDRIVGLTVGADDYVTKPFSPRELVARVHALMRRPRTPPAIPAVGGQVLRFGELVIDAGAHEVTLGGQAVALTPHEFELLTTLAGRPGQVFTRDQLLERVWGDDFFGDEHVVDVHVSNLRRKLDRGASQPRYVETVRGVGYRFRRPD
ncbi:MAG TPA: response regulator transcription factor [Thermomicrobiaceae bacterium]|nr:response regulator transcription factor [Thermomicrobiaceae bacterium]